MEATESNTAGGMGQFGNSFTLQAMQRLAVLALSVVMACVAAGLNQAGDRGWIAATVAAAAVWALWLLWRGASGHIDVPRHHLFLFLFVPMAIYLAHLFTAGLNQRAAHLELFGEADGALAIRLALLALVVLLVQDLLPRTPRLRWIVIAMCGVAAMGGALRLRMEGARQVPPALLLSSLSCVLMLLSQIPSCDTETQRERDRGRGRILFQAFAFSLLAIAAAMALWRLLNGHFSAWGAWQGAGPMADPGRSGWTLIGEGAGLVGLASVIFGMLFCLLRSVLSARWLGGRQQFRAAIWLAATLLAGGALLSTGGLALPSCLMIAGLAFGLLPHMMGHEQRAVHGWPVAMVFGLVLLVMGLANRLLEDPLCACMIDDRLAHYLGGVVTAGVLIWQGRCRRWGGSLLAAGAAAVMLSMGEVAQEKLSARQFEYGDMFFDALGSLTTWGAFCLVLAAGRIERLQRARARKRERYLEPDLLDPTFPHASADRRAGLDPGAAWPARSEATPAPSPTAPAQMQKR